MRAWYVAKTKPRQELQASNVLQLRGLETYFPMIPARRRKDANEGRTEALFPGYLFARLDQATPEWVEARSAPGISYFLGIDLLGKDRIPTPVPDELVDEIRRRVERREYQERRPKFHRGERVVIVGGPLEGVEAIFDGTLSPSGRSRVLVAIVSGLVPVHLDADDLRQLEGVR